MKPQNQTFLTIIMALFMVSGFVGVFAIGEYYEANTSTTAEIMWESDSNLEFQTLDTSRHVSDLYKNLPNPYGVGTFKQTVVGSVSFYEQNNCTPVYTGNNTWAMTMTGWLPDIPDYTNGWHHLPILIPNANSFIAETIDVSFTMAGDVDQYVQILLGSNVNPEHPDLIGVDFTVLYPETAHFGETLFEQTFDLTTFQKLEWFGESQNKDDIGMWIYIREGDTTDGLSSFAMEFSISVTGVPSLTWSLQDSMNIWLGFCVIINIGLIIYLSDVVDFQAVRKDLPKRKNGGK